MTFEIVPDPKVEGILGKMWQKDPTRFSQIEKKLLELRKKSRDRETIKKTT